MKTRLQSREGFFASGGFKNVYRGIGSVTVGSAPSAALFFVTYDSTKRYLLNLAAGSSGWTEASDSISAPHKVDVTTKALIHMAAGSLGETAGCLIRVPVEVVKQRAQAKQFKSSKDAFMNIVRSHSGLQFIREMYRGAGITLLREIPFTMIQFPLWEALKVWHVSNITVPSGLDAKASETIGAVPSALYGSLAGAVGAGLTTPLDVLKTRLMLSRERVGAVVMFKSVLRESGPKALFAGIVPRVGWISVGGAVFLGSYQWASNVMEEAHEKKRSLLL